MCNSVFIKAFFSSKTNPKTQISLYQGQESHDLLRLFYTCIRTKQVKKLFIFFFIINFHVVKCRYLVFTPSDRLFKWFYATCCIFARNHKQRISFYARAKNSIHLLEVVWKYSACTKKPLTSIYWLAAKAMGYLLFTTRKFITVKILKFGTPQTIAIIVLRIEKFDETLH